MGGGEENIQGEVQKLGNNMTTQLHSDKKSPSVLCRTRTRTTTNRQN